MMGLSNEQDEMKTPLINTYWTSTLTDGVIEATRNTHKYLLTILELWKEKRWFDRGWGIKPKRIYFLVEDNTTKQEQKMHE